MIGERQSDGIPRATVRAVQRRLVDWYVANRRDLPWRRTRDPYAIWVSEAMLQQTQVATVVDYYARWMHRFPSLHDLACADEQDVLATWQGLGYYSRARNLQRAAQIVVAENGGRVPNTANALRALPGIGAYSAGAIASIAYGEPTPVIDGNVIRVLTRLFGLRGDPAKSPLKRTLWSIAAALVPADRAADFNQGLMELGATICTPRQPDCAACPLARRCVAHRDGLTETLPELAKRRATIAVHRVACIALRSSRVLVVQRPRTATRCAGFWQFPDTDIARNETPDRAAERALRQCVGLTATRGAFLVSVKHSVTHHRITLDAYCYAAVRGSARPLSCEACEWKDVEGLEALPMPSAHRRIARRLIAESPAASRSR